MTTRRQFIAAGLPLAAAPALLSRLTPKRAGGPIVVASGNGQQAVARAMEMLLAGAHPCDAVVGGVTLVEDDPKDNSVGYGGLPNEDGVVQLDASVMDGPLHKAGSVCALEDVKNAAVVALKVLRETDHVILVGAGAKRFAVRMGFKEENLLTEESREAWLKWKRNLNSDDDWLSDDQRHHPKDPREAMAEHLGVPFTYGTIHCAALTAGGDIGACTTTSGLSWKLPGRVGDSPIIGAGMFVDNDIGAAGATGRGEAVIQSCGAFQIVQHMSAGAEPEEACFRVLKWIASHTRLKHLLNDRGEPNFGLSFYALRKDGTFGGACMRPGGTMAVCDAANPATARVIKLKHLYSDA